MSQKMKQTFKATALAAALLAVYGPALAEDGENSISVGIGSWSNDRHQQGQYDGMRDNGGYGLLDFDLSKRDEATGTWLGLKARNLGLDSRELELEWQRQGDIGASFEYSSIPRDYANTYNTRVQGIGSTTLRVPTPSTVPNTGVDVDLGTVRERSTLKFFKSLGVGLNFNASFRNEEKEGTRPWGRGGAAEFAVEPINSTTRQFEAILSYARDKLQLSGGYYGTTYDNANGLVVTSLTTPAAATTYNLSLPLSTKSHEFFLNGGYDFTPTTRGTFKMSYSTATQDEGIPTATAPGLVWTAGNAPSALAPTHLDGRLDTTMIEAGLTAKPMPKLNIVANLRYRDFDDKTPVQGIVFTGATPTVYNTPFSYTTKTGKLEATYRLPQSYSLLGGLEYKGQDRTVPTVGTVWVPFRQTLDETAYRVQLSKSMSETVNGSVAYVYSKRDGSTYVLPGDPLEDAINPMNITDRNRNKVRAMADWSPMEKLALQFVVEAAKDDYSGQAGPYGLQDGTARVYSVDANYAVNNDWQMHAWYTRDETKANEVTQQSLVNTKYNNLSEIGDSFGLGISGKVSGNLKMGGDVESFRSVNKYNQTLAGGVLAANLIPTPDITNSLLRFRLFAQYAINKSSELRFNVIYEDWGSNDWSWMNFAPTGPQSFSYGTTTDGTTVRSPRDENSTFLGVRYIYKF